jgi:hypothetical protein
MAKKGGGVLYPDPFNEVGSKDPNSPDVVGDGIYFDGWDEINKMHLQETGDMISTANSESGHDLFGGPTPGEANPAGMAQHKGS